MSKESAQVLSQEKARLLVDAERRDAGHTPPGKSIGKDAKRRNSEVVAGQYQVRSQRRKPGGGAEKGVLNVEFCNSASVCDLRCCYTEKKALVHPDLFYGKVSKRVLTS